MVLACFSLMRSIIIWYFVPVRQPFIVYIKLYSVTLPKIENMLSVNSGQNIQVEA